MESSAIKEDVDLSVWLKREGLSPRVIPEKSVVSGGAPCTVLLTGCTGFLGRHILLEFLNSNLCDRVYCHVRGRSEAEARARLLSLVEMVAMGLTSDASRSHLLHSFDQKVSVVLGDLSQPLLGLKEDTFHSLSKSVDIIVHNGARVNHVLPYTVLRDSNIGSIKELFKLAFNGRPKLFHYVSSIASLACASSPRSEDSPWAPVDRVTRYTGYGMGYMQTKWVGEHLVLQAAQRGYLRAIISRPSLIGPNSVTGQGNQRDWLSLIIRASFDIGVVPLDSERDYMLHSVLPVDYVARGILATSLGLARGEQTLSVGWCGFPVFHYANSEPPLRFFDIFHPMTEVDSTLKRIDFTSFRQLIADAASLPTCSEATRKANSLLPTDRPPHQGAVTDTWTQRVFREDFGITVPQIDKRVLMLYVRFLAEISKHAKPNVLKSAL